LVAATFRAADPPPSLDTAYTRCASIAKHHYENFTVASLLLPKALRPYFHAVYAFCRHTDDLGDEAEGDRISLLDDWEAELVQVYGGTPSDPIMVALQDVVRRFEIPDEPFRMLIQANRMDQGRVRFPAYDDVLHYCEHSAMPVGRMILYLLGDRTDESRALSDATCTALQLANFWQDVARDYAMNRIYIPLEDMVRFGYTERELAAGTANRAFRNLLRFEVGRAQELFEEGLGLIDRIEGRAKFDIALFSKGGMRVLDAIRAQGYDVLSHRPTVPASRKVWLALTTGARLALLKRP
jgi:squalene synthase HpnC